MRARVSKTKRNHLVRLEDEVVLLVIQSPARLSMVLEGHKQLTTELAQSLSAYRLRVVCTRSSHACVDTLKIGWPHLEASRPLQCRLSRLSRSVRRVGSVGTFSPL